jgi:hypothetical protein
MMLLTEPDPERPGRVATRIILEEGEFRPKSLLDLRVMLRQAIDDLPGRIDLVPWKQFGDKRK